MSAETRSWATAEDKRADLQQRLDTGKTVGPLPQAAEPKRQTVAQAIETFITAKQSEGASTGTIRKLRQQLGMLELIQFRAGWTWKSGVTRQKAQQNLRAFLRSCSKENLQELLGGTENYPSVQGGYCRSRTAAVHRRGIEAAASPGSETFTAEPATAAKLTALIHFMISTGVASRDAVQLERETANY